MVTLNPDTELVKQIKAGLMMTGGFCPCRLERTEANRCMCEEFRHQMDDPDFEGFCHCMLYYKSKEDGDRPARKQKTKEEETNG